MTSSGSVVDRNGTPLQRGQYVTIHTTEGARAGVVAAVFDEAPLDSGKGHWVDVQGLLGIEGVPSTMLEVMPDSRNAGRWGVTMELSDICIPPTHAQQRDALRVEVERLRSLLREVAASGVRSPAEPPWRSFATVLVEWDLWEILRQEFGQ